MQEQVKPCLATLVLVTTGCSAGDGNTGNTTKDSVEHYKSEESNVSGIQKIIINGSPIPPEGYKRPVVDIKKEKSGNGKH